MRFSTQYEARRFLVDKIADQASRAAAPLSEAEERMLHFNLDDPGPATMIPVEILEDKSGTYEKKFARLLQAAYSRDGNAPEEQQRYREAIRTLKNTEHYILIIASDAIPQRKRLKNVAVYLIIAVATAVMIVALQLWTRTK